jgi:hypothetical protein
MYQRAYRLHPRKTQEQIAMYMLCVSLPSITFYVPSNLTKSSIIWVEEHYDQFTEAVESFQYRWLSGQPQMHPMLDRFSQCLKDMRKFWDPLCADMMVSSTFYFLYGNILENRANISQMKLHGPSILWPNWVREMTGVATVISLFIFPKSACDDVSKFLQAVPEIDKWINYSNDILSCVFSPFLSFRF